MTGFGKIDAEINDAEVQQGATQDFCSLLSLRTATHYLKTTAIRNFAQYLVSNFNGLEADLSFASELHRCVWVSSSVDFCHRFGINMRFIGLVRTAVRAIADQDDVTLAE